MPANVVDNAVGVTERKWFVGIVKRNTEKAAADKLTAKGIENYVAIQRENRIWRNGRKAEIDRVVINTIVFVKVTEKERMQVLNDGIINRFMINPAAPTNRFGRRQPATVRDEEIETLRFMLYNSDSKVDFTAEPLMPGEKIRVVRGTLKGFEGNVIEQNGANYVCVALDMLGYAMTQISLEDIQRI